MDSLHTIWAGTVPYDAAWDWQKELVADLSETAVSTSHHLLLLEHPPTYTLGRRGTLDHLLLDEAQLVEGGFTLRWVDRGGDITYHGPGQLVGYPILNLKQIFARRGCNRPDLHLYLRDLEEGIIQTLAGFDIKGWRYKGYTGVWVDSPRGPEKIAAIGIRVNTKGISSHGFALNVQPDLNHFSHIIPCGIQEHGVTSMSAVLGRPFTTTELVQPILTAFQDIFDLKIEYPSTADTSSQLSVPSVAKKEQA
ncbi:MAG: lipoyl(octanoyl) transferase [Anaerolineaceae bacterium]|nr:lipoyl(octanoyl) transferase [Anaerolineaceae bacterium]